MTKRRKPIDLDNASREELIAYIKRVERHIILRVPTSGETGGPKL